MLVRPCFRAALPLVALAALAPLSNSHAQPPTGPQQTVGKYRLILRPPTDGIYAGEAIDIEFRLVDTTRVDPVGGPTGVVRARTSAVVTMPEMPGMPAQNPKVHSEGVPGDYGLECFFPHGGTYQIALSVLVPGESQPVRARFTIDVLDAEARKGRKPAPMPYRVEVRPDGKVEAGIPATLRFTIRDTKTKAVVRDFDIAHTKTFHLLMASRDLDWFVHEHPEPQPDGTFTIAVTFPAGDEYRLFADVAPRGAGSQILGTTLKVTGMARRPVPLVASPATNTVDGLTAALSAATPLPIGRSTPLTFTLTDSATRQPVTGLQPYLGAYGHLMVLHADGQTVVHSHPAEDEAGVAAARQGRVTFSTRFPRPGTYKAWGQFQRDGAVVTIPFVLSVGAER
jgi:hypothetical protein